MLWYCQIPVLLCLSLFENRSSNILIVSDFVPSSEQNTVSDHFYIPFLTLLNFHWHQQEFSTCNDCMVFPWTPFLPQSFLMKHRRHVKMIIFFRIWGSIFLFSCKQMTFTAFQLWLSSLEKQTCKLKNLQLLLAHSNLV